jgi:hypothetical protein
MHKRRLPRTDFESEHANEGPADSGPGFEEKLEIAGDGRATNVEVGRAVDYATVSFGEVGVLVCEEVTNGVMDVF